MSTLSIKNIRNEIVNALRSGDILSISVRGATTATETFTATAGQTVITPAHNPIRNIRTITVNAGSKHYISDFTFNNTTITMTSALTLADSVVVTYDYGATAGEKIYPDFPRGDLTLTSFPRVGLEITSLSTVPLGLGGTSHISQAVVTLFAFVPVNKDSAIASGIGGTSDLSDLVSAIRNVLRANSKLFSSFQYIYPITLNPINKGQNDKIMSQGADYLIKFMVENG